MLAIKPNIHNQSRADAKRDVDVTVAALEVPGEDDREYLALRRR